MCQKCISSSQGKSIITIDRTELFTFAHELKSIHNSFGNNNFDKHCFHLNVSHFPVFDFRGVDIISQADRVVIENAIFVRKKVEIDCKKKEKMIVIAIT